MSRTIAELRSLADAGAVRIVDPETRELKKLSFCWLILTLPVALFAGCSAPKDAALARGQELYDTCVPCHGRDGSGNHDLRAPSIAGLPEWYIQAELGKFFHAVRGAHPDDAEGARMRPMARTLKNDVDMANVAKYVASLKQVKPAGVLVGGVVASGKTTYEGICVTCHMADGKGNKDLGSPDLSMQADWYLLAQLEKFKTGMRGAHPDDATGQQMAAMSQTLADEQAMKDVIAYIRTLHP